VDRRSFLTLIASAPIAALAPLPKILAPNSFAYAVPGLTIVPLMWSKAELAERLADGTRGMFNPDPSLARFAPHHYHVGTDSFID